MAFCGAPLGPNQKRIQDLSLNSMIGMTAHSYEHPLSPNIICFSCLSLRLNSLHKIYVCFLNEGNVLLRRGKDSFVFVSECATGLAIYSIILFFPQGSF